MLKKHRTLTACVMILVIFTSYVIMDTFFIKRVYGEELTGSGEGITSGQEQDLSAEQEDQSSQADQFSTEDTESAGNMHDGSSGGGHRGPGKGHKPGTRGQSEDDAESSQGGTENTAQSSTVSSDSYQDENISITLKSYRENDTTIYVADVNVSSPEYLNTAFAQGSYGRNVTQKTSEIAENAGAILAVNGDYYGAQEKGYVIRNGKLYRDTAINGQEDLVIYSDGSFGIINEGEVSAQKLIDAGAVQTLSFGPALVMNGSVSVTENEEVGKAAASNPRTAIGMISKTHYVFVVSDGRTDESAGLSLHELAEFMDSLGVKTAYNLDGGGSSTMYFNGSVVNNPTGGMGSKERSVSDIVYIGK